MTFCGTYRTLHSDSWHLIWTLMFSFTISYNCCVWKFPYLLLLTKERCIRITWRLERSKILRILQIGLQNFIFDLYILFHLTWTTFNFIVKTDQACLPNFETLIGKFEVKNETLNWNFETPAWNFIKFVGSSLKLSDLLCKRANNTKFGK